MEVGEQWERYSPERLRPVCVAVNAVDADSKGLSVCGQESTLQRFQRWHLAASGRGEIERIEEQQNVASASELVQVDTSTEVVDELEVRRLGLYRNHVVSSLSGCNSPQVAAS